MSAPEDTEAQPSTAPVGPLSFDPFQLVESEDGRTWSPVETSDVYMNVYMLARGRSEGGHPKYQRVVRRWRPEEKKAGEEPLITFRGGMPWYFERDGY